MRQRDITSPKRRVVWNEAHAIGPKSFVGYLKVFSDKTATKLKSNDLVSCPVHIVLMKCSAKYRRWLTENAHIVVGSLQVRVCSDLKDTFSINKGQSFVYWFTGTD